MAPSARTSFCILRKNSSKKMSTPLGLVNTSHWYSSSRSRQPSTRCRSFTGSTEMAGSSSTSAPRVRSFSAMEEISFLGRVTTALTPARGSFSYQPNRSAREHTLPTTMMAGVRMPAFLAASGRSATVATTRRCPAVVPCCSTAAGMAGSMPASRRPRQISGRAFKPIRNTRVPFVSFRALKSIS